MWKAVGALSALVLLAGVTSARTTRPSSGQKKASSHHSSGQSSKSARSKARKSGNRKQASRRRGNWRSRGQQAIKEDRAREIQTALIREHYLTGEPTGLWDDRTKKALIQYQGDHGWQTKKLPDARALIQLGLGPAHEGLLNPGSVASTGRPSTAPPATAITTPR
jgi:peptidoglycan hydrolase-like protein with peptidoglycan-binding domain